MGDIKSEKASSEMIFLMFLMSNDTINSFEKRIRSVKSDKSELKYIKRTHGKIQMHLNKCINGNKTCASIILYRLHYQTYSRRHTHIQ